MVIKRYLVNDMNEAMTRIRDELGRDAIIVSKKKVRRKGALKFFQKKVIEVTAAVDKEPKRENKTINNESEKSLDKAKVDTEIIKEIDDLKKLVTNLAKNQNSVKIDNSSLDIVREVTAPFDFEDVIVEEFINYCNENNIEGSNINRLVFYKFLKDTVNTKVKINSVNDKKVQVYIGPTGVGKTTTIAKMAANEALVNKRSIALITVDTYRIGAVEQLKTYANILGVPIEVVLTKEDLLRALEKFKDYDRILIDSMGRSDKNHEHLMELKDYFVEIEDKNTYLVVSITTKNKDLRSIIENYKKIGYDNIIITKLDETDSHGSILNISYNTDCPIGYICTGQNVPDDIEEANRDNLFQYIWGEIEK